MSVFLSSQLLVAMEHNAHEVAVVSTVPERSVGAHQLRVGLVGLACKLAGGKSAPDQLWSSLLSQTSHITHSPPRRWQGVCTRANAPAALLAGAFLDDELHSILAVEHGGFSAVEAKQLDMHIQLLLDTSMKALTDGGWSSSDAKSGCFGVFTASQPIEFVLPISGFNVARAVASALRIAGPHRNTDAACSSGYLSTHHALGAVQAGECSAAVVAGVSLLLKPDSALGLYMMGVLSPSGNMRPFDTAADGMVWGEACIALVLQAEAPEENAYVTVLASATNCNNALSPSGFVAAGMIQAAAEDALALAGITPQQLAACHPHGMGNPPSDVPELTGLVAALATARDSELVLLGHKANFGHSVCAAGLVSVVVSALALQQNMVPAHLNIETQLDVMRDAEGVLLPVGSHALLSSVGSTMSTSVSGTSISGDNAHAVQQQCQRDLCHPPIRFAVARQCAVLTEQSLHATIPRVMVNNHGAKTTLMADMLALAAEMADQTIQADDTLIGGPMNSTTLVRFAQRASKLLDITLPVSMLLQYKTIRALIPKLLPTSYLDNTAVHLSHGESQLQHRWVEASTDVGVMDFSVLFFGSDNTDGAAVYDLVVDAVIAADQNKFKAVWLPERHFEKFGGSFPNPNTIAASLAMLTEHIRLRAGSVNLPQHATPLRVVEDWSMVDNLSGGRVDISFGAGWNVIDFALLPQNFLINKVVLWESIQAVRTLWQGGQVEVADGLGRKIHIQTRPSPIQPALEVWVSAVTNPQTFWDAGAVGANMLFSVFGQSWEELGQKVHFHRQSLEYHGFDPSQRTATCELCTALYNA